MSRSHKALIVLAVATLGLWGCAQGTSKPTANSDERIKVLEAKCSRLESDHRTVTVARDQIQKKLAELDKERVRLQQELEQGKVVSQERDELKVLVATRTAERDAVQGQFEELRKGIRSVLGRVESALPPALDVPSPANYTVPRSKL